MIKKLVVPDPPTSATPPTASDSKGVKLPKLEAPTFDGKLINWISFWQQFNVAIHSWSTLSDVEKLAYLRNSLKDGSAPRGSLKDCQRLAISTLRPSRP